MTFGTRAINSLSDMRSLAIEISQINKKRLLLLLDGEMGAGKTQLTRFLVEALGGGTETASPSFAIHNGYPIGDRTLEHFDLFRLQNEDELESTGFWDLFRKPNGIIVIEWAERLINMGLKDQLPLTWPTIEISIVQNADPERRQVTLTEVRA